MKCRTLSLYLAVLWFVVNILGVPMLAKGQDVQLSSSWKAATDLPSPGVAILLRLTNRSKKVITAYSVGIIDISSGKDGQHGGYGTDFLPLVISQRLLNGSHDSWDGAILPNGTFSETIPFARSNVNSETPNFRIVLTGILYADGSKFVSNDGNIPSAIEGLIQGRVRQIESYSLILGVLQAHSAETDVLQRITDAIKDLRLSVKATTSTDRIQAQKQFMNSEFQAVISRLQSIASSNSPAMELESYTSELLSRRDMTMEQTS
jgi:hypothetical protein